MDDVRGQRFIPPGIRAFLNDRRIDPAIRAYLLGMAGRNTDTWTLAEFQFLTAVVPSLTEIYISTSTLSEFYEFMGLDPASLFEPQLGQGWQASSTTFDPRFYGNTPRRCRTLQRQAQSDPSTVKVQALLSCADPE